MQERSERGVETAKEGMGTVGAGRGVFSTSYAEGA
jgi:hypothetical protein